MSVPLVLLTVSTDPEFPQFDRHGEPVAIGVTVPRGSVRAGDGWALRGPRDEAVPVQVTPTNHWGDGSVRWLLVEFRADVTPGADSIYSLLPSDAPSTTDPAIAVDDTGDVITVRTGVAEFAIARSGNRFLADARVAGMSTLGMASIEADDDKGKHYQFATRVVTIERSGSLTVVLRLDGELGPSDRSTWLEASVRLHFFGGLSVVRAELSVTNPRAARHPGGLWDLGDPGSVLIRNLAVRVTPACPSDADVRASIDRADPFAVAGPSFQVYQDSSGGAQWQHVNHANRDGRVPVVFQGFRATRQGREMPGLQATPIVSLGDGAGRISVALPHFWEVFPKSIAASAQECVIGVFPEQSSSVHELQGGERCTFAFSLCFGDDPVSADPLAWARSPLRIAADPESYRRAAAWAPLAAGSHQSHTGYEALVNTAIAGAQSFQHRRELIDEYGWRNFGEIYADHESVRHNSPLVSHYNNQYDAIAGFGTRFLQTGDWRWLTAMDELANHVVDIDLYNTTSDRAAYNGGYFWHTQHYSPAGTATHRAYSRLSGSSGGGPSAEHNYTSGLLLHYLLTGSERSRAAVIQLARWVIDMDDGAKSRFRWLDRRETGFASSTRSPDYHGPGRGAGNSINALLDAHRLTNEIRYLEKADALLARCVHPDDDPDALNLLDAENRWSYTVFLQTLGKYLEHRADLGLMDERYAYARAVLLKYATWMCAYERPYLDTPEGLEYPNETWAAHDLRKAAVFEFAAKHTDDEGERHRFLAEADRFVDYAITMLQGEATGRLSRPLVLLLAYGVQRPMFDMNRAQLQAPAVALVARAPFVPLRRRVVRRLIWAGAGLSAAALMVIVLLIS